MCSVNVFLYHDITLHFRKWAPSGLIPFCLSDYNPRRRRARGWLRVVVLSCASACSSEFPGPSLMFSALVGVGRQVGICLSNKFPGDARAASTWTILQKPMPSLAGEKAKPSCLFFHALSWISVSTWLHSCSVCVDGSVGTKVCRQSRYITLTNLAESIDRRNKWGSEQNMDLEEGNLKTQYIS